MGTLACAICQRRGDPQAVVCPCGGIIVKWPSSALFPGKAGSKKRRNLENKRRRVYERDGHRCVECGRPESEENPLTIDHIIPRSRGGTDAETNLQTMCFRCNQEKADTMPEYPAAAKPPQAERRPA